MGLWGRRSKRNKDSEEVENAQSDAEVVEGSAAPPEDEAMEDGGGDEARLIDHENEPDTVSYARKVDVEIKEDEKDSVSFREKNRRGIWPRTALGWLSFLFFWFIVLFALFVSQIKRLPTVQYDTYRDWICVNILRNDCDDPSARAFGKPIGDPIITEQSVLSDWVSQTHRAAVLENKFRALDVSYSKKSASLLNTDNILLGLYEKEKKRNDEDGRPVEAGIHFLIAGSNGDFDGRELFEDLDLSENDRTQAQSNFIELHRLNGREGYFRLGLLYLGDAAMDSKYPGYPTNSPPPFLDHHPEFQNDFIVQAANYGEAYKNMHIALLCDVTEALQWQGYIATVGSLSRVEREAYERDAAEHLKKRGQLAPGGIRDHCYGETLQQRIKYLTNNRFIERFISDGRPWPTYEELIRVMLLPPTEFGVVLGDPTIGGVPGGAQGSQYFRNNPGGQAGQLSSQADDGLNNCDDLAPGQECPGRLDALACRDIALSNLKIGEAYLAAGNIMEARKFLQRSTDIGRRCQAEAARQSARLLQALNLTCEYTRSSLARISREASKDADDDARAEVEADEEDKTRVIGLYARQRALSAHGYYDGNIDGKYGPMTRQAVRDFQRGYGFSQTGDLTPIETVYLFCSAAEIKDDPQSMNTLGLMYLTGLGVVQNTDAGLNWLKEASRRSNINAKYNLALAYGTATVKSSYELCDIPENLQRADAWLVEAANLGHPTAQKLVDLHGTKTVSERWLEIEKFVRSDTFHSIRLDKVGRGCEPN
ncbi:MAG: peptidoglycan-binding protein [Pseudomonadota bacterium]